MVYELLSTKPLVKPLLPFCQLSALEQISMKFIRMKITYLKMSTILLSPGGWFNIKMTSYQYRKSHYGDKMIFLSPQWDFLYWSDNIFILNQGPEHVNSNPNSLWPSHYIWHHRSGTSLHFVLTLCPHILNWYFFISYQGKTNRWVCVGTKSILAKLCCTGPLKW